MIRARIFLTGVTAFWLVMNYFLWQNEVGGHSIFGSSLPASAVWEKMLTAPDSSKLDIYDHDNKTGTGTWTAGLSDSPLLSSKILSADFRPGAATEKLSGYTLSFEGNLLYKGTNRVHFQISFALNTNKVWKDFHFHANMRPRTYDIHAMADEQKVKLAANEGGTPWERTWDFAELRDPQSLIGEVGGAFAIGVLSMDQSLPGVASKTLQWAAYEDRLKVAGSTVRAYRLESFFFGQKIEIYISLVGEILEVNLPRKISLRNQAVFPSGAE